MISMYDSHFIFHTKNPKIMLGVITLEKLIMIVVDAWYEEKERKKDPSYKKTIAPQFEYNQFIRDFFADPKNQGKSRDEAIEAWNKIKKLPGRNQYESSNTY